MIDLRLEHVGHKVWCCPHAFTNLGAARQATGSPNIDVVVFIRRYPLLGFHVGFSIIGPASIDVCISSPVRSRNPVLINATAMRNPDALCEVRWSDVLVHNADLHGVGGETEKLLDTTE